MKVVVSGFALIFMVLIGVYMVIFSENEEKVKTQRKQIVYTLIGFLFLNIPGIVYQVMSPADAGGKSITL
jgi:glucose uptake protein GlcU